MQLLGGHEAMGVEDYLGNIVVSELLAQQPNPRRLLRKPAFLINLILLIFFGSPTSEN